jgi:hypothetical protein
MGHIDRVSVFGPRLGRVNIESERIGDIGNLALADTALSELVIDMLGMLRYADLFTPVEDRKAPDPGLTTKQAARQMQRVIAKDPRLFPKDAPVHALLDAVLAVSEERNQIMHAVALNRCVECGNATLFQHPRSGRFVDRSEDAVQELTDRLLDLREQGIELANQVAWQVNRRIFIGAMVLANDIGETVVPETVMPRQAEHTCGDCNGDGRATARVTIGLGGVEIHPDTT